MADAEPCNPASRYRAGNGALFTSSKCPPPTNGSNRQEPGGLSTSCELPFGFLYTPMAVVDTPDAAKRRDFFGGCNIPRVECTNGPIGRGLPPILCLTCLAYINLYASVDPSKPGIWHCALCGSKNVAPPEALEMVANNPALISPLVEYRQPLPSSRSNNNIDQFSSPNPTMTLVLVLDANLSKEEAHAIPRALRLALASSQNVYLGLIIFEQHVSVYQLGLSGIACADVFTALDGLTEDHLRHREYLTPHDSSSNETFSSLDRLTMCISAAFGVVEGNKENHEGEEMDRIETNKPLSRLEMLKQRKAERLKKQGKASSDSLEGHRESSVHSSKLSPWMIARRMKQDSRASDQRHTYRATGEAIHTALNLTKALAADGERPSETARILLFTNGCVSYGDGSVVERSIERPDLVDPLRLARSIELFDTLARSEPTVAIDVLCTGSSELAIASYQALVEPSGGYVLPHESFATPQDMSSSSSSSPTTSCMPLHLQHNLAFLLQHTYISSFHPRDFSESSPSTYNRVEDYGTIESGCLVDIRASPFLMPTHLVGPGELVTHNNNSSSRKGRAGHAILPNELSAFAWGSSLSATQGIRTQHLPSEEFVSSTLTRLAVGRVDPLSTYSIMFRTNDAFAQRIPETNSGYAFFQCIARFVDPLGKYLVTRVATHRLAIAKDVGEYLDSVDDEVIPVVLGKEAVYRSMYGREMLESDTMDAPSALQLENLAFRAQDDLDATIARISGAYRLLGLEQGSRGLDLTEGGGVRAAGSSFDFAFPPELSVALRRLYYLRRGPLLNPGPMRSLDDRAEIRSLFIRFPMEDCLCMMAPLLWRCGPNDGGILEEILPETLALWSDSVLVADNHHTIFIWSGRQVSDSSYDGLRDLCRSFLLRRSEFRFPQPQLHQVKENDSMSRRFTTLLAPSHGDPIDHSLTSFPALSRLSAQELEAVRGKFKFYDPESDPSFRSWFWSVVSATSKSKDQGISLCE